MKIGSSDALMVVDVQNDFLPGGALAVKDGDAVIAPINRLIERFPHVLLSQDWHTPGHISFASSHPGRQPFETMQLAYGAQVLWPDHCIQGMPGAALAADLDQHRAELIIRKGFHPSTDSYSAFTEADRRTTTGLQGYLNARGFSRLFVCGLATDYCVAWTALDGRQAGLDIIVVEDACRAIDLDGSLATAWQTMAQAGVTRTTTAQLDHPAG